MMDNKYPPVSLVEAWIFILTSKHDEILNYKEKANIAITQHFGSIEIAQIYVDELRKPSEQRLVS